MKGEGFRRIDCREGVSQGERAGQPPRDLLYLERIAGALLSLCGALELQAPLSPHLCSRDLVGSRRSRRGGRQGGEATSHLLRKGMRSPASLLCPKPGRGDPIGRAGADLGSGRGQSVKG